jgi:hypothetical protein
MKRYERLASQIGDLIQRGDLPPGTRIPAVRAACDAYGVSPSTVFRAYYLLFCAIPFLRRLALIRFFSVHVILVFRKDLSHSHPLCEPCASSA